MSDFFMKKQTATLEDAIKAVISDTCICDFGIVQEVLGDGSIVTVEVASALDTNDIRIVTCVLAGVSTQEISLSVYPKKNDRVLILYPRRYSVDMFSTDSEKAVVDENARGYAFGKGIAFLLNQALSNYKNTVTVKDSELEVKLSYDKNQDKNLFSLKINSKGEVDLKSGDVSFNTTDGLVNMEDKNHVKFTTDSNGYFSLEDGSSHKIVSNNDSITINGHLKVK
jgi:hypothetical protein